MLKLHAHLPFQNKQHESRMRSNSGIKNKLCIFSKIWKNLFLNKDNKV
jgi:hypothetical protein